MQGDNKFIDTLNMSALGDKLREAREGKNITLSQAQKQTRIHLAVLKAIEDGKCDDILNPTYVKSFLKKYAEYLGVNTHQVLNEYNRLHPVTAAKIINRLPETPASRKTMPKAVPLIIFFIIASTVIALAGLAVLKAVPYIKSHVTLKRVPSSRITKTAAQARPPKKNLHHSASAALNNVEINIPKNAQLKLLLKVKQKVFIKMKTDGTLLFERELPKGTAEIFTANDGINIFTANGAALELFLNGKAIGPIGKGTQKNIEITRTGVRLR